MVALCLSEESDTFTHNWLHERGKVKEICPRCGKLEHHVNSHAMEFSSRGTTYFPAVLIHCFNCTFTSVFSAKSIGLVPHEGGDDDQ